jgi:hypothetical protein
MELFISVNIYIMFFYIFCSSFTSSKIYLEIIDKTEKDKYSNVVFLLDISKLVKYIHVFLSYWLKIVFRG